MKFGIGISLIAAAGLSYWADQNGLKFPTVSWGFNFARSAKDLVFPFDWIKWIVQYTGEITAVLMALVGFWLIISKFTSGPPNPVTLRKIQRFKAIKRGYYSFLILLALGGLAALDQVLVGKEALAVKYEEDGEWQFPAFTVKLEKYRDFGVTDPTQEALEPDYREMKKEIADEPGRWVILPLRPYSPDH